MTRLVRSWFFVLCAALLVGAPSLASREAGVGITPAELFPWARFDPAIPTQKELLGVEHGARPLRHAEIIRYLSKLAELSPRARLVEYSRTHEGRQMVYFAVSDAATVARLDDFRTEHSKRLDPRGRPKSDDASALDGAKAVAWMAYGIHGDELSSVDASVALAYWLVAGEDDRAKALRGNLVVLIDPMENPDGRDRYLAQTASFAHSVPNPDTEDLSHTATWPWGRGNHYLFDLNRDWFSMVQPESRRSGVIAGWDPQLAVDCHEMGADSSYLFPPPRHPFNPLLPPAERKWWTRFSQDQARALDGRGYAYFTREWNEEFFPGYGSSWVSYRGALGILYEMSRTSGTLVRKHSGEVRTYPQAVEHQTTSSVANLETLSENREEFLADFVAERREAIEAAGKGTVATWVLPRGRYPERTDALVSLLRRQGIEVVRWQGSIPGIAGLHDILSGESVDSADVGQDVWAVPVAQPAARMVRVLLDPHVPMDAEFFRDEREYLEKGRGSRLYETTAWSLILAYGVEGAWTHEAPKGDGWTMAEVTEPTGSVDAGEDAVSWFIEGTSDRTMPALADLLQRGLHVRVADRPVRVDDGTYARGSLLIPVEGNPDDLRDQLQAVAERFRVKVHAVSTALAQDGPDLGGSHFLPLVASRVGVWSGYPISPTGFGAIWHLFDYRMKMRFTSLDIGRFGQVDLARYNVLVFPPAFNGSAAYRASLGESGVENLKQWIQAGGTAIGVGNGADFLADKQNGLTVARMRRQALDSYPPMVLGPDASLIYDAGSFRATGIRSAEDDDDDDDDDDGDREKRGGSKKGDADRATRRSPYDVAPILGAGARPFAEGIDQGTPVEMKPVELSEWVRPMISPSKLKAVESDLTVADQRLRRFSPQGAFLRLDLDPDVWLTWGMPKEVPALISARDTLVAQSPVQVAARFAEVERLHLGGLLWPEAAARFARTAYATRESSGRGQVILFIDEPAFRGWTRGTMRMLQNAVLYGPGLGTRWSTPW